MTAVIDKIGPIIVSLNEEMLINYDGYSIIDNSSCSNVINHNALAVGYGTDENGLDYYIVKNSWGSNWGK